MADYRMVGTGRPRRDEPWRYKLTSEGAVALLKQARALDRSAEGELLPSSLRAAATREEQAEQVIARAEAAADDAIARLDAPVTQVPTAGKTLAARETSARLHQEEDLERQALAITEATHAFGY